MQQNPFLDPNLGSDLPDDKPAAGQAKSGQNPFLDPNTGALPPARGFGGWARDAAAWGIKGAIALPEGVVGLADLATGGYAGKGLEGLGVRFKEARELVNDWHSDATKEAQRKFQQAEGLGGKFGAALQNPTNILGAVIESAPSMMGGGAVGRGLLAASKLGQMGAKGAALAGAVGEGVMAAGSSAEQMRQQTDDGLLGLGHTGAALATGLTTGAIGAAAGRLQNRLGIGDVDTLLAQGRQGVAKGFADDAAQAAQAVRQAKSLPREVLEGAVSEGLLEELPQSLSEQLYQNLALGKPWHEGMDDAAVMGILTGGAMGAGAGAYHSAVRPRPAQAGQLPQPASQPPGADAATGEIPPDGLAPKAEADRAADAPAPDMAAAEGGSLPVDDRPEQQMPPEADAQHAAAAPDSLAGLPDMQADQGDAALPAPADMGSTPGMDEYPGMADGLATGDAPGMDDAPYWVQAAPIKPSEAMGLNPDDGALSAAAAAAVDSGATAQMLGQAQQQVQTADAPAAARPEAKAQGRAASAGVLDAGQAAMQSAMQAPTKAAQQSAADLDKAPAWAQGADDAAFASPQHGQESDVAEGWDDVARPAAAAASALHAQPGQADAAQTSTPRPATTADANAQTAPAGAPAAPGSQAAGALDGGVAQQATPVSAAAGAGGVQAAGVSAAAAPVAQAAPSLAASAARQWADMPADQREAVAIAAGLRGIVAKHAATRAWDIMTADMRQRMAQAMGVHAAGQAGVQGAGQPAQAAKVLARQPAASALAPDALVQVTSPANGKSYWVSRDEALHSDGDQLATYTAQGKRRLVSVPRQNLARDIAALAETAQQAVPAKAAQPGSAAEMLRGQPLAMTRENVQALREQLQREATAERPFGMPLAEAENAELQRKADEMNAATDAIDWQGMTPAKATAALTALRKAHHGGADFAPLAKAVGFNLRGHTLHSPQAKARFAAAERLMQAEDKLEGILKAEERRQLQAKRDAMLAARSAAGQKATIATQDATAQRSEHDARHQRRDSAAGRQQQNGVPQGLPAAADADSARLERIIDRELARGGEQTGFKALAIRQDQLPDALRGALAAFERVTGTRVAVFRNLTPEIADFNGMTVRDGVLFINEDSQNPLTSTAAHEWVHNLRNTHPQLYQQLEDEVRRQGDAFGFADRYGYSQGEAHEELTAAAVGDAMTDPAFLQRLAERDTGLFQRVARAFLQFLDTLASRWRDQGSNAYLQDVQAFRDKLADVLALYEKQGQLRAARALEAMEPVKAHFAAAFDADFARAKESARAAFDKLREATEAKGFGAVASDGRKIKFSGRGFKELAQHAADRRVLAVGANLKPLFESAIPLYSTQPEDSRQQVSAFHYYGVKADFGKAGQAFVMLEVIERTNGEFFYDADATSLEEVRATSRAPLADQTKSGAGGGDAARAGRFAQWWASVNRADNRGAGEAWASFARKSSEPRDLVALHNLTADSLVHADELGALAVPSIGIARADESYGGYGEITLIGPRELIDPQAGVPVFDRDAYTQRFPQMNYKRPKARDIDALLGRIKDYGGDVHDGFGEQLAHLLHNESNPTPQKAAEVFSVYLSPQVQYARQVLGKPLKVPMRALAQNYPFSKDKAVSAFVRANEQALRERDDGAVRQLSALVEQAIAAAYEAPVAAKMREALLGNAPLGWRTVSRIMADVHNIGKKEVDKAALESRLRRLFDQHGDDYRYWAASHVQPLFDAPTITLRGKQVAPTLDNIVAAMTAGAVAGREKTFVMGGNATAARLGKRFKSVDEIRAARNQLMTGDALKAEKASREALLESYRTAAAELYTVKNYSGQIDTFEAMDASMRVLVALGKKNLRFVADNYQEIVQAFHKEGFDTPGDKVIELAQKSIDALRSLPAAYFEAKPQRAVGIDEFAGAVVPRDVDARALAVLQKHGLAVQTYGKGWNARDRAVARLAQQLDKASGGNVMFSRKAGPDDADRQFADTERAYGGQAAWDKARAEGKTRLNYQQWVQVRTPNFKQWFGDWEIASAKGEREANTFDQAREAAKAFQGKPLTNTATGIEAKVSRNALDKMLSGKAVGKSASAADHAFAVANLDQLFERAVLGWSKPDRDGDPNIVAVHRFFAPVLRNGQARLAKLTVKETARSDQANPLYTVESVTFNEKSPAAQWVDSTVQDDGLDPTSIRSAGDVRSLAQRVQDFNPANVSKVVDPNTGEPQARAVDAFDAGNADIRFSRSASQSWPQQEGPGVLGRNMNTTGMSKADTVKAVREFAEHAARELERNGLSVQIQHSGSVVGPSSYLDLYDSLTGAHIPQVRISNHSKGAFNAALVIDIGGEADLQALIEKINELRTPERIARMQAIYERSMREEEQRRQELFERRVAKEQRALEWADAKAQRGEALSRLERLAVQAREEGRLIRDGGRVYFDRSAQTRAAYDKRIDELFAGAKPALQGVKVLDSSDMLGLLGFGPGPVHLAEGKVKAGLQNHPRMTAAVWKQVPEWLENPAAVFDSDTDEGLVFLAPQTLGGAPLSIIVRPSKDGAQAHLLLNAYDRSSATPFARWIQDGLLRYAHAKEFPALFEKTSGRRLPGTALQNKPGTKRILTERHLAGWRKAQGQGAAPAATPEQVQAVQQLAEGIARHWQNAPEIVAVASMQDERVPDVVRAEDAAQKSQGASGEPEGFFYGGKVYVLASEVQSRADVARVVLHEALGHYGLHGVFGSRQLASILNRTALARNAQVIAKAREYGLHGLGEDAGSASDRQLWASMSQTQRLSAAEEVLAEMAQEQPNLGLVREAIAAIRAWLRKHVPGFRNLQVTDDEIIRDYILPARDWVMRGKQMREQGSGYVHLAQITPMFSRQQPGQSDEDKARILQGAPVASVRLEDAPTGSYAEVARQVGRLFASQGGKAVRADLGDVALDERAAKSSLAHGGANIYKKAAFAAVKDVIERGALVMQASHERTESYYISAPVQIDGISNVVTALVRRDHNGQRMYLHSVTTKENLLDSRVSSVDAEASERSGSTNQGGSATVAPAQQQGKADSAEVVAELRRLLRLDVGNSPMFSRRATQPGMDAAASQARSVARKALDRLDDALHIPGRVSLWHRTIGTMRNLAERQPLFKPVFESAQRFIDDTAMLANDAADAAPSLMPRMEGWRDVVGRNRKRPISAADSKSVAQAVFAGTAQWARDASGKLLPIEALQKQYANLDVDKKQRMLRATGKVHPEQVKAWLRLPKDAYDATVNKRFEQEFLRAGVVFTPAELRQHFGLSDTQIELYQQSRQAIDRSLDTTARAAMLRAAGPDFDGMRQMVLDAPNLAAAADVLARVLREEEKTNPQMQQSLSAAVYSIYEHRDNAQRLMDKGYAPLMRFGKYTVTVKDAKGQTLFFGMHESASDASRALLQARADFPDAAEVVQGTMSELDYQLLAGVTPESLEIFGNLLGQGMEGDAARDAVIQKYIQLAKNNHSALKRMLHRKGVAGYSEDLPRVLASFVYANARQAAGALNAGRMDKAIRDIPKTQGQLRDVAMGLRAYMQQPQEEGQVIRGFLFAQYLGGSVASALVNMTQPFAVTMPWLSQYGGMWQASAQMARAVRDVGGGEGLEADLAQALKLAEADGTVAPQEIHQLMAQARGAGSLRVGDGKRLGNARAHVHNAWERTKVLWGVPFSLAEAFNRRTTFIAAFRNARARNLGPDAAAAFARRAVLETQFIYSRANKPRWARGAVGGALFTFKTYSVSYLELMGRMWSQGGPEGKRAVLWALAMLLLTGGAGGLPFAEDAEDLIDAIGQMTGYNISAKQWRRQALRDIVGDELGEFIESGVSGLPGAPVDVSGRLGMGNLLPGTGLLLDKQNRMQDLLEVAGPAGDFIQRGFKSARNLATGDVAGAAREIAPNAVSNLLKGLDMAASGIYSDKKGYKVLDVTLPEAAAKAIGFQPRSVAEVQEGNSFMQRSRAFYTSTSNDIKAQWAKALYDKDERALARVRQRVADWNLNNPEQPIRVQMPDIWRRVREMGKSRTQRIADNAPRALRQQMRQMAAQVDGV